MKTAHLQCASGIAGDMMLAALIDAGADLAQIQHGIDSLGMDNCRLEVETVKRHGFRALKLNVHHEPEHAHRHLSHIQRMIDASMLTDRARSLTNRIFLKLAEAEAHVHGTTVEKVHFHEVGAVDSIADIVGTAMALDLLDIGRLTCEPVPTGQGTIQIAHGTTSVPAPATAELLKGIPLLECSIPFELTTPTGAAIVAALADTFGGPPSMTLEKTGCGAGDRDLPQQANVLRILLGQEFESDRASPVQEFITVLETSLDDATGEVLGHCLEQLLQAGALDAYTSAIQMKKHRPGVLLTVLCESTDEDAMLRILFSETTTIGVRTNRTARVKLPRTGCEVTTHFGSVRGKSVRLPNGQERFAPEYESCRELAQAHHVSLQQVMIAAHAAYSDRPHED